jgi:ethanolamine utilization microcompartment shell protein EutL
VNPNKDGGRITILAIENVEDIKANIEAEIAKLDATASTSAIDSLLEEDIIDS